ncbi:MAG: cytochrome c biogenesis protein CcsA [Chitinophagales bacterium]
MNYIGEHLLPGKLGHFFVLLSLVSSLVAAVSFFKAAQSKLSEEATSWKRLGRIAFLIDAASVFSIFATIYYLIRVHYFEYNFAWSHSSMALDFKYLLSCIWEAQEGSFLLWTMWHAVLGIILIFRAKQWEAPVLTVISIAQFCLATMILGLYFFGSKVGNSPFMLVRQMEGLIDQPLFSRADYLSFPQMKDGQGLNALLQNYWMVIHPPVLFLGFASTIVPFSFAIAGLWKKHYGQWTKVALPWTLFSACVLGTGIMMGAAWAYESLTFGGYWAWDPVENASLVPWLILIAGLHTQVIYNSTGHSLRATYLFIFLSFIMVLYATYLTRSGKLGDTSVHAFVESGMDFQLISFILIFFFPAAFLYIKEYKRIPHIAKEENTYSREFWMFIGSLIIFLSAIFIIIATSLPIINSIAGTKWTTGEDAAFAYNRIEIFIAIILGILTAVTQYLKYKDTSKKEFGKKILLPTAIALGFSLLISIFGGIHYDKYGTGYLAAIHLALFSAVYAIAANIGYIRIGLHGKLKAAGASVAHLGFGILLLGILISSSKKTVLSWNTTGINLPLDPAMKENPMENITLLKNVKTDMGKYWTVYNNNDSLNDAGNIMYFKIDFTRKDGEKSFSLYPNLIKNTKGQENYSHNPDKYHYWDRDIFVYLNYANAIDKARDTTSFHSHEINVKDTVFYSKGYMILDKIVVNPDNEKYHFTPKDTALMGLVIVISKDSMKYTARPLLFIKDNEAHFVMDTVFAQNLAIGLGKVTSNNKIELLVKESFNMVPFVSLKAYEFPQINLVWLGIIIMMTGFVMSIIRRRKQKMGISV